MTAFECTLCGKCCMNAGGQLIEIEKRLTSRDYLCRQKVVGGTFRARVEERFLDAFRDTAENDAHPSWCPFLRGLPGEEGKYICTIHDSRPLICRSYVCCAMRIFAPDGREAGKVKGRRSLDTEDAVLRRCWEESVVPLGTDDDLVWRSEVAGILGRAGYRVEAYE
ncbi:YkgJ family cysteine cluster protein [Methanoculleus sp. YWC-01]|uniref:YkgJ family cysteine cluster protein n=1 Tax=Methanoculleus nereidis TaxID=2735141 RepID=A0ABU3Z1F8_9EURY|nr:YkgJ family cysteine cluster protein [Methanoculleus sp. YWC-01]MDV4342616.1 YkgJ family cysteine cluster protein [Methanoculleus sp. YWC-01]